MFARGTHRSRKSVLLDLIPALLAVPVLMTALLGVFFEWPTSGGPTDPGDDLAGSAVWATVFAVLTIASALPVLFAILGKRKVAWIVLGAVAVVTAAAIVI